MLGARAAEVLRCPRCQRLRNRQGGARSDRYALWCRRAAMNGMPICRWSAAPSEIEADYRSSPWARRSRPAAFAATAELALTARALRHAGGLGCILRAPGTSAQRILFLGATRATSRAKRGYKRDGSPDLTWAPGLGGTFDRTLVKEVGPRS
jgi:hypothetical protein